LITEAFKDGAATVANAAYDLSLGCECLDHSASEVNAQTNSAVATANDRLKALRGFSA